MPQGVQGNRRELVWLEQGRGGWEMQLEGEGRAAQTHTDPESRVKILGLVNRGTLLRIQCARDREKGVEIEAEVIDLFLKDSCGSFVWTGLQEAARRAGSGFGDSCCNPGEKMGAAMKG